MKKLIAALLIATCALVSPAQVEAEAPVVNDLVYHGRGETARQIADDGMGREAANAEAAQEQTGRWEPVLPEATPDDIEQERIDDEISNNFDIFCDVIYAEAGGEGEKAMRLVADVVINRMRDGNAFDDTLRGVLTAPYQFSCVDDGHAKKFAGHSKGKVRRIAQEELMNTTDNTIYYFRTEHFTPYGADAYKCGNIYFSRRKTC